MPTPAIADRLQASYKVESTYGVSPSGNYQKTRIKSDNLKQDTGTTRSTELRSDRQVADFVRNNLTASGSWGFEFSYKAIDDLIFQAGMASGAWSSPVTVSGVNLAITASTGTITRATGSFSGDGLVVGQWIKVTGFSNAANNDVFKLATVGTTTLTVVNKAAMVDESTGSGRTVVMGEQIVNGTTLRSFTLERQYTDLSNIFATFPGSVVDKGSLSVNTDGVIIGSVDFMGQKENALTASPGSGYDAAQTNTVMNAVDNVLAVFENGLSVELTSFNFSYNNNCRPRRRIAALGAQSIGYGKFEVSGSVEGYFVDTTQIAKYLAFTATSLAISFKDDAGNRVVIEFPKVRFSTGPRGAEGENTDVMQKLDFTAMRLASEDCTMRVVRWDA